MRVRTLWVVIAIVASALGKAGWAQPILVSDTSFDSAVRQARFIFVARLRAFGPAPEAMLPAPYAALLTVDTTVRVPMSIGALSDSVKITLPDTLGLIVNRTYVVYAIGLSAESTLVLGAVAVRAGSSHPDTVAQLVAATRAADERNADRSYWSRYDSAAVVVTGVVGSVKSPSDSSVRANFEHAPLWQRALIRIDSLYKGRRALRDSGFTVLFPASRGVPYRRLTPLVQGQSRLLTLRALGTLPVHVRYGMDTTRAYVLLDSLDNLAPGDTSRITRRKVSSTPP